MTNKNDKNIAVHIDNTVKYLQMFNGIFNLTDTEMQVLAAFTEQHLRLKESGLQINAFSTDSKKSVAKKLGRKDFNQLNGYIKALHDKGAIDPVPEGYKIKKALIPQGEDRIIFNLRWS